MPLQTFENLLYNTLEFLFSATCAAISKKIQKIENQILMSYMSIVHEYKCVEINVRLACER